MLLAESKVGLAPDLEFSVSSWREHWRDQQWAGASVLGVPHGLVPVQLWKCVRDLSAVALHVGEVGQEPAGVFQPALQRPGETLLYLLFAWINWILMS